MQARGRFTLLIVFAFAATATVTHAEPHVRPRTIPVYVFAGQSNMVGASSPADDLAALAPDLAGPQPNVLFFGPTDDRATKWAALQAPTEIAGATYGPGFGPELSAADALATPHQPIAVVKYAHDGTNLYHDWDPSRTDGLYAAMILRTRIALAALERQPHATPHIEAVFWMQGEGDSYEARPAYNYGAHLTNLLKHIRTDLEAPHVRFVLGKISLVAGIYAKTVRDQQALVATREQSLALVETGDLAHDPASLVHLNASGEIELGRRFARALSGMPR